MSDVKSYRGELLVAFITTIAAGLGGFGAAWFWGWLVAATVEIKGAWFAASASLIVKALQAASVVIGLALVVMILVRVRRGRGASRGIGEHDDPC